MFLTDPLRTFVNCSRFQHILTSFPAFSSSVSSPLSVAVRGVCANVNFRGERLRLFSPYVGRDGSPLFRHEGVRFPIAFQRRLPAPIYIVLLSLLVNVLS